MERMLVISEANNENMLHGWVWITVRPMQYKSKLSGSSGEDQIS